MRLVNLWKDLLPGGDMVEYLAARRAAGLDDAAIRTEIEALADAAEPTTADAQNKTAKQRPAQADLLIALANEANYFHTPGGDEAYATVPVGGHWETIRINAKNFRSWLARRFYEATKKAPNAQAMQDTLGVLAGRALYDGPEISVAVRLAVGGDSIWLDLADTERRAVEITVGGWRVVDGSSCPVRFIRPRGVLALPVPIPGGSLEPLRRLANLDETSWPLALAWMVAAVRPVGPYPVLALAGEQGSGKSTTGQMLRAMIDPNSASLRAEPREARDLMIAARNGWIIALDNLSRIAPWLSDGLCRLATGGGFATRELYADAEEIIFDSQRPVILNGIEELTTRADLADRAITLTLPTIMENVRRSEAELWRDFENERPGMLGALLDAASTALRNLSTVKLTRLPRLADFALWATAAEPALPVTRGTIMAAYVGNRAAGADLALESAAIGPAVLGMMTDRVYWNGTAAELLAELETHHTDDRTRRRQDWPKTPRGLSGALRRLAPVLRQHGISAIFPDGRTGHTKRRTVSLEKIGEQQAAPAANAANPKNTGFPCGLSAADAAGTLSPHSDALDDLGAGCSDYPEIDESDSLTLAPGLR